MEEIITKGAKRRSDIVSEAVKVFGTHGYSETSIQSIADACGISHSAVLYHFQNKLVLFKAVVGSIVEENANIISGLSDMNDNAYVKLQKHFEGHYVWAVKRKYHAQIMTCIYHLATFDRGFQSLYGEIVKGARGKILAHLLAGQRERLFVFRHKPELVAHLLHDQLLGSLVNSVAANPIDNSYASSKKKWLMMLEIFTR